MQYRLSCEAAFEVRAGTRVSSRQHTRLHRIIRSRVLSTGCHPPQPLVTSVHSSGAFGCPTG